MAKKNIFIAKWKGEQTHVFLRAYRREALRNVDYSFSSDYSDELLLAQDPESFICAVGNFHPLSLKPLCKQEELFVPRMRTVKEFDADFERLYEPIDAAVLMEDLTGVRDDGAELNKSSLRRAAKEFDAVKDGGFMHYLKHCAFAEDDYVVAEPVRDWVFAKAVLSNIVLFQVYYGVVDDESVLAAIARRNGCWVFGKAFDKREEERAKLLTAKLTAVAASPLQCRYFDMAQGAEGAALRNALRVRLKSADQLKDDPLSLFTNGRRAVVERAAYLVADADRPGKEIARDFVNGVLLTTQELRSENGEPLGWEYDYASALDETDGPAAVFHSQWARLVYEVAFHHGDVKASVCKNCGRPMLNQPVSKPRQFCRPSCKTAYCVAHKAGGAV